MGEDLEAKHQLLKEKNEARMGGQLQRLEDLEAKQPKRPDFCSLRLDPGPCKGQVYRWYYLPKESDCLSFPWGGCGGNDNNFLSLAQCRAACLVPPDQPRAPHLHPQLVPDKLPRVAELPRVDQPAKPSRIDKFDKSECYKPPEAGPCQERLTRFYYDRGECKSFEYSSCGGNLNNFFSVNECRRKCLSVEDVHEADRTRHRAAPTVDTCNLPPDLGNCQDTEDNVDREDSEDNVEKFYWDKEAGSCVKFAYSGCGGNSNNFVSRAKCVKRCGGNKLSLIRR